MLNRAMQEDVVAIEMLPEAEWTCPSSMILEHVEDKTEEDTEQEVIIIIISSFYKTPFQQHRSSWRCTVSL